VNVKEKNDRVLARSTRQIDVQATRRRPRQLLVGDFEAGIHRNFFAFDASFLSGCVRSESVQVPLQTFLTAQNDLGTGAVYASKFLPTNPPYASEAWLVAGSER
jgi:hypothetical protein